MDTSAPWATYSTADASGIDPEELARGTADTLAEHGVEFVEMEVAAGDTESPLPALVLC